MTTTVRVLIEGDKVCEIRAMSGFGLFATTSERKIVNPYEYIQMVISDEQYLSIKEVGDLL